MTLRAHIYIVNKRKVLICGFVTTALSAACAGSGRPRAPEAGLKVTALDVGKTGRPDSWRYTKAGGEGKEEILVREEVDLNSDGKVDLTKYYEGEAVERIVMDLDFDGKPDVTEHYREGVLVKEEVAQNFAGRIDSWRYYEKGGLSRVERDTNGDGKPDLWMYYEGGALKRLGKDVDFDGVVDTWEE